MDNQPRKRKSHTPHQNVVQPRGKDALHINKSSFKSVVSLQTFASCLLIMTVVVFVTFYSSNLLATDNTFIPFDGHTFPSNRLLGSQYWSSLLSGHYFGLKSSSPNSPIVSTMWFRNRVENNGLPVRHWCEQGDKLDKFFWNYNDLTFGHQSIKDKSLYINTSFIRHDANALSAHLIFKDTSNKGQINSIILYAAIEDSEDTVEALNVHSFESNPIFGIRTHSKLAGNYTLNFKIIQGAALARSYLTVNSSLNQLKETILQNLYIYRVPKNPEVPIYMIANGEAHETNAKVNFVAYQIAFQNSIQIEAEMLFDGHHSLVEFNYEKELEKRMAHFDEAFEKKFLLRSKNFTSEMVSFARAVLSNTIGGISYFNGYSLVKSAEQTSLPAKPYGPLQLLTAVPSRPFFPRGFLWDEGFHQLLISTWDPELSKTIIQSWLGLMNKDGWIPREVILGDEAMARVPSEFLTQHSSNANPPVFFLAIEHLIDQQQADKEWLTKIFPRLERWFNWFNTTQRGQFPSTFRWRGRNATTNLELNPKTLTSGLDDFPRASHPTDDEIHLDLRCWMAMASRVMSKVQVALSIKNDSYQAFYELLRNNQLLEKWHWSPEHQMFCDKGLNSDVVRLVKGVRNGHEYTERQVLSPPKYQCIPHFGYVNLFPMIMGLLDPTNSKLESIFRQIEDPESMWSPYGLRSISKRSFYYHKYNTPSDAPYWRGPIWIPINFLVLKGLNHYGTVTGPYQVKAHSIYVRLRENIIRNVFNEYRRTNYVWENYADSDGKGQGTYPMTGWTALVVRIMGERYWTVRGRRVYSFFVISNKALYDIHLTTISLSLSRPCRWLVLAQPQIQLEHWWRGHPQMHSYPIGREISLCSSPGLQFQSQAYGIAHQSRRKWQECTRPR